VEHGCPLAGDVQFAGGMTWLTWLILALVVAVFAGLTGAQPKGARPVARTRLMGIARVILVVVALVLAYAAFRARTGG
jgi:hypothetical protein